ncbi:hypothetical protein LSH36_519g04126, partial [Paralvinella palmiformis]
MFIKLTISKWHYHTEKSVIIPIRTTQQWPFGFQLPAGINKNTLFSFLVYWRMNIW